MKRNALVYIQTTFFLCSCLTSTLSHFSAMELLPDLIKENIAGYSLATFWSVCQVGSRVPLKTRAASELYQVCAWICTVCAPCAPMLHSVCVCLSQSIFHLPTHVVPLVLSNKWCTARHPFSTDACSLPLDIANRTNWVPYVATPAVVVQQGTSKWMKLRRSDKGHAALIRIPTDAETQEKWWLLVLLW